MLACFALNILFYLLIIYRIQKIKRNQRTLPHATQCQQVGNKLSKVILRFSVYLLVFFVCWVFDVLTYVVSYFDSSCNPFAFIILYSILLNLQVISLLRQLSKHSRDTIAYGSLFVGVVMSYRVG